MNSVLFTFQSVRLVANLRGGDRRGISALRSTTYLHHVPVSFRPAANRSLGLMAAFLVCACFAFSAPTWHQVNGSGFTVLTSDSPADAETLSQDFQQFVQSLSKIIPVETARLPPLTITMISSARAFRPYRPLDPQGNPKGAAGIFARDASWASSVIAGDWNDDDLRHIIQHEGVHWFLSNINVERELWLEEGLAEVFATAKRKQNRTIIGYPIARHVHFLREYSPMSLARMMAVDTKDPEYNETARIGRFYSTSWLLVHYVLCGQHQIPRSALDTYLDAARRMERPAAFAHAFGMGYEEMQKRLEAYLIGGKFIQYAMDDTMENASTAAPMEAVPAKPETVEVALARLALKVGNFPIAEKHISQVRSLDPDAATADELDGYLARERRDYVASDAAFARAVAKGSRDFGVYYWPAKYRVSKPAPERVVAPVREKGSLQLPMMPTLRPDRKAAIEMDDPRRVANQFKRAINLQPRWRQSYTGLAATISHLPALQKTDYDFLLAGARAFPEELDIWVGIALYEYREGQRESARKRLSLVIQAAGLQKDAETLGEATRLSEAWDYDALRTHVIDALNESRVADARAAIDRLAAENRRPEQVADLNQLRRAVERAEANTSTGAAKDK